jgi:L-fuconolactonase
MFIDAHQHFWYYNPHDYSWINEQMSVLKRDFLPEDLLPELKQLNFKGSIAVQARQSPEETYWLLQLASEYEFIKGVVGWADLCSTDVEKQLERISRHPKLVGVRHVIHDEPDDRFMAREDFRYGISLLSKYNLTYDLLIFAKHLSLATELAYTFPDQKFVLDHMAKPGIKNQIRSPWDKDIGELAKLPNVYCKLSGMVTEADWKHWKASDFRYYLDVVFDRFGEDRLMIGSDWPVCSIAGDYRQIMPIVIDYLKQFNEEIRMKIMGTNCRKFYLEN